MNWKTWTFFIAVSWSFVTAAQGVDLSKPYSPSATWVHKELLKMNLSSDFIQVALQHYQQNTFETVLHLNILGFLQPPQHLDRVDAKAIKETAKFLKERKENLRLAEKKFQVPGSVISALLWIETRHGEDRGDFHILSVFLHLLQVNRYVNIHHLTLAALEINKEKQLFPEKDIRRIIADRTLKKRIWAREQIFALARIYDQKKLNLAKLKGSFAGAFGMAQFIPSSYVKFAQSENAEKAPDLGRPADAIVSVAHYLKKHGWKKKDRKAQIEALMKYNNSRDYAESILEISERAAPRSPSSVPKSKRKKTRLRSASIAPSPWDQQKESLNQTLLGMQINS